MATTKYVLLQLTHYSSPPGLKIHKIYSSQKEANDNAWKLQKEAVENRAIGVSYTVLQGEED